MKTKGIVKVQVSSFIKPTVIFYAIMLALIVLLSSITFIGSSNGYVSFSGTESSSIIFIFIAFLVSFREHFNLSLQNGVSRKTMIFGSFFGLTAVVFLITLIDAVIAQIANILSHFIDNFSFISMVEGFYGSSNTVPTVLNSDLKIVAASFVFNFCCCFCFAMIAMFLSSLNYRMNKFGRICTFGGLGLFIFIIFPVLSAYFIITIPEIMKKILKFICFALGIDTYSPAGNNPYHACVTFIIIGLVFYGLFYLSTRKLKLKARK